MKCALVLAFLLSLTACNKQSSTVLPTPTPTPVATPSVDATPAPAPAPTATPAITAACALETSLTTAMASGIGTGFNCKGTDAIQKDLLAVTGKLNLCKVSAKNLKAGTKGTFGNIACPMLVSAGGFAGMSQVPAAWQCDGGTTLQAIETQLITLCEKNISI